MCDRSTHCGEVRIFSVVADANDCFVTPLAASDNGTHPLPSER
jgi:hypothetical protein